jgi:sarcosine oxidase subunit gamma
MILKEPGKMSDQIRLESPLVRFNLTERAKKSQPGKAGVKVAERPFLGHINLRGNPNDQAFVKAVEGALGFGLPLEPNTIAEGNGLVAYWLCPDEWLVVAPGEREADLAKGLRSALSDVFSAVTETSGAQTVIVLSGPHAWDLLAKGCTLDLHPRAFGPGRCAQSLLAKAGIIIRQLDESPSYEIIVRRSFADYLWQWMELETKEYGLSVVAPS